MPSPTPTANRGFTGIGDPCQFTGVGGSFTCWTPQAMNSTPLMMTTSPRIGHAFRITMPLAVRSAPSDRMLASGLSTGELRWRALDCRHGQARPDCVSSQLPDTRNYARKLYHSHSSGSRHPWRRDSPQQSGHRDEDGQPERTAGSRRFTEWRPECHFRSRHLPVDSQ